MLDKINTELQIIADEMREERIEMEYDEELMNRELELQYEMMQNAADLENFSPFDTINS